jgi:histidine ammonia-lyase
MLVLALRDFEALLRAADIAAAMSVEAVLGTDRAFAADLQALRPHPGQARERRELAPAARGIRRASQAIARTTRASRTHTRCAARRRSTAPRGCGGPRRARGGDRARLRNRQPDDPPRRPGRVVLKLPRRTSRVRFDFLAIAAADVGSIAERRTDRLLDPVRSIGLPPFLAEHPGVDSGLMLAQYTQAAMVAECRRLAVPASVDSLPTSASQEEHVSGRVHARAATAQ